MGLNSFYHFTCFGGCSQVAYVRSASDFTRAGTMDVSRWKKLDFRIDDRILPGKPGLACQEP